MQSAVAIAEMSITHQSSHQNSHHIEHQYNENITLDKTPSQVAHSSSHQGVNSLEHNDEEHPDCHYNHCHHSNLTYIDLASVLLFYRIKNNQVLARNINFSSFQISPALRPPIA